MYIQIQKRLLISISILLKYTYEQLIDLVNFLSLLVKLTQIIIKKLKRDKNIYK